MNHDETIVLPTPRLTPAEQSMVATLLPLVREFGADAVYDALEEAVAVVDKEGK